MSTRKAVRGDIGASKAKQLPKRLRKAEDQLLDATAKRDRAQARVEALSIIAGEIRAQLAETEKAATATHARAAGDHGAKPSDERGGTDVAKSVPLAATGRATRR